MLIDFEGKYSDLSRFTGYKAACVLWEVENAKRALNLCDPDPMEASCHLVEAVAHIKELEAWVKRMNDEVDQEITDELNKMHDVYNGGIF